MKILPIGATIVLALTALGAQAAEPVGYVFATYHNCNDAGVSRADALFAEVSEPLLKKQVAAGNLVAYGWSKHWLGGSWRRLSYVTSSDLDKLLDGREAFFKDLAATSEKAANEFSTICTSHDDYLWSVLASSQAPADLARVRGAYGNTTYFVCNENEEEADEIVTKVYAPILDRHVKEGKIASWSWLRHVMGGKYRRALVFDAADTKAVVRYWPMLAEAIDEAAPQAGRRFGAVCPSHTDYVWELSGKTK